MAKRKGKKGVWASKPIHIPIVPNEVTRVPERLARGTVRSTSQLMRGTMRGTRQVLRGTAKGTRQILTGTRQVAKGTKELLNVPRHVVEFPRQLFDYPLATASRIAGTIPVVGSGMQSMFGSMPSVDMVDEGSRIRVRVDLPGVDKRNIKLHVSRDSISVRAETRREQRSSGKNYYYMERSAAGYSRMIALPSEVDASTTKAKFENGTLEITVDKRDASKRGVKIF